VPVAELKRRLEAVAKNEKAVLSSLTAAQLEESKKWGDRTETVRRIILIILAHYATHLGHLQLTYQLWLAKSRR
jgi:hypothetical protein